MEFPTILGVRRGLRFFDDIREVKLITVKHAKKGSKSTQRKAAKARKERQQKHAKNRFVELPVLMAIAGGIPKGRAEWASELV